MNQTEMIPYIKIAFEICHSWSRTSDLKDRSTEITQTETEKKIVKNKAQYNIEEVWDKNQIVQLIIIGISEGEVRE